MSSFVVVMHLGAIACFSWCAHLGRSAGFGNQVKWLVLVGILFQASAIYQLLPEPGFRAFSLGVAVVHYALFAMVAISTLDRRGDFPKSWTWLCMIAALASLLSVLPLPERDIPPLSGLYAAHLAIATLAYSIFIVCLAQMTETFLVGKSIAEHERRPDGKIALLDMEKRVFSNVRAGFVLLTLTIISGAFILLQGDAEPDYLTHKNVFAVLTWVLCAIVIVGRWNRGWRGMVALRWYAASTGCLLLSYLGTIIVLDLILRK